MSSGLTPGGRNHSVRIRTERGFTLIEALVVVAIIFVMTAISIPLVQSTLAYYDLRAAVSGVSGAIQTTRYRALSDGYPYTIKFSKADNSYQVGKFPEWDPTKSQTFVFTNDGSATSFSGGKVVLGTDATIEFLPSGRLVFLAGNNPITLTRDLGKGQINSKALTVSSYGTISIK